MKRTWKTQRSIRRLSGMHDLGLSVPGNDQTLWKFLVFERPRG
jgi:hypothetical protein